MLQQVRKNPHPAVREAASSHCLRRGSTLALRGWGIPPHP